MIQIQILAIDCWGISLQKQIKIYGLLRSGTNYMRALLEWNTDAEVIFSTVGGWKHGFPQKVNIPVICLLKNPYAFAVSLFNYRGPSIQKESQFKNFLRSPIRIGDGKILHQFTSPIDYWNRMVGSYIESGYPLLQYEEVLVSPAAYVRYLADLFDLEVKSTIEVPENRLSRMGGDPRERKDYEVPEKFSPLYYHNFKYMCKLDEDDIQFINYELNSSVINYGSPCSRSAPNIGFKSPNINENRRL